MRQPYLDAKESVDETWDGVYSVKGGGLRPTCIKINYYKMASPICWQQK